jgi:hypothetical protein
MLFWFGRLKTSLMLPDPAPSASSFCQVNAEEHQIVLGRWRIGDNPIDLAWDERCLVVSVADAHGEWFGLSLHAMCLR